MIAPHSPIGNDPSLRHKAADNLRAAAFERGLGVVLWTGLLVVLFAKLPF